MNAINYLLGCSGCGLAVYSAMNGSTAPVGGVDPWAVPFFVGAALFVVMFLVSLFRDN